MAVHSMFPICKPHLQESPTQWPSFLCCSFYFGCAPLLPKVLHNWESHSVLEPLYCRKICPKKHFLPHFFLVWNLPLWDLDLLPLMFLPVWSVLVLAKFLLSGRAGGHTSSTSEAFTVRRPWPGFKPPALQPTLQQAKGSQRHKRLITTKWHNIQLEHRRKERNIQNIFMKVPNIWDPRHISNMLHLIWDFS